MGALSPHPHSMLSAFLSLFKKPRSWIDGAAPGVSESDEGETIIDYDKMSLDERKAWRHEMLRASVREILNNQYHLAGMYRYRATILDKRGHYYVVMIELTNQFVLSSTNISLEQIERDLCEYCSTTYNVVIDAVYWKANKIVGIVGDETTDFYDTQPMGNPHDGSKVTERVRLRRQIGDKEYDTDLSPLGSE